MTGRLQARQAGWGKVAAMALPLVLLIPLVLALRGQASAQDEYQQLIEFNHRKHVEAGIQCLFCHPNTQNGPVAGIPSMVKCMGCHQNIQVTTEEGQQQVDLLVQAWQEEQPLRWAKTLDLPDFVYFAHRPHIATGRACEDCHGDVGSMDVFRVAERINMGFCLNNCHRHQDPEKRERLMDCATCHM